ncbi:MAG: anthranilate synthase component I family protein [Vampirovibrionales bacterium]
MPPLCVSATTATSPEIPADALQDAQAEGLSDWRCLHQGVEKIWEWLTPAPPTHLQHWAEAWQTAFPTQPFVLLDGGSTPSSLNQWRCLGLGQHRRVALHALPEASPTIAWQEAGLCQRTLPLAEAFNEIQTWLAEHSHPWEAIEADNETHTLLQALPSQQPCFVFFAYEAYRLFEPKLHALPPKAPHVAQAPQPLAEVLVCDTVIWQQVATGRVLVRSHHPEHLAWLASQAASARQEATPSTTTPIPPSHATSTRTTAPQGVTPSLDADAFSKASEAVLHAIHQGEVYQANLSSQFVYDAPLPLSPMALFQQITQRNPSPFAGVWYSHWGCLVSNSPERLVQALPEGRLSTRPIAGTRSRGSTPEADDALADTLRHNEKERAEHLMLVDLERNDLGRVCVAGSVQVDELMVIERYSHVQHLVSNVIGQKQPEATLLEVLQATFPGGTITGCPKVRCIELLHRHEPAPRGAYTGSMGYLDWPRQQMDTNILIRTVSLFPAEASLETASKPYYTFVQAGAGMVHDSTPKHEFLESLKKASALWGVLEQESAKKTFGGHSPPQ